MKSFALSGRSQRCGRRSGRRGRTSGIAAGSPPAVRRRDGWRRTAPTAAAAARPASGPSPSCAGLGEGLGARMRSTSPGRNAASFTTPLIRSSDGARFGDSALSDHVRPVSRLVAGADVRAQPLLGLGDLLRASGWTCPRRAGPWSSRPGPGAADHRSRCPASNAIATWVTGTDERWTKSTAIPFDSLAWTIVREVERRELADRRQRAIAFDGTRGLVGAGLGRSNALRLRILTRARPATG